MPKNNEYLALIGKPPQSDWDRIFAYAQQQDLGIATMDVPLDLLGDRYSKIDFKGVLVLGQNPTDLEATLVQLQEGSTEIPSLVISDIELTGELDGGKLTEISVFIKNIRDIQ